MQFKSDSHRTIKYVDHEVRWLESLKLPLFIGSIRKRDSAIDLYPTHRLSQVMLEMSYQEVHLNLDRKKEGDFSPDLRNINIGPPLLSWSTHDLANADFAQCAYSVLKPYLEAEQRNIEYRSIRYLETIIWKTGEPPKCEQGHMLLQNIGSDDEILRVFRSMAPHLHAVALRAITSKDKNAMEIVIRMIDYMRAHCFDPDPNGIYYSMYRNWDQLNAAKET